MRRESNFYLMVAAAQLTTMLFVAISWATESIPNTWSVVVLKCCFFVLALVVLYWSSHRWAELRKWENDERRNTKS